MSAVSAATRTSVNARENWTQKNTNGAANCRSFSRTFSLIYIGLKPGHPATRPAPRSTIFGSVNRGHAQHDVVAGAIHLAAAAWT